MHMHINICFYSFYSTRHPILFVLATSYYFFILHHRFYSFQRHLCAKTYVYTETQWDRPVKQTDTTYGKVKPQAIQVSFPPPPEQTQFASQPETRLNPSVAHPSPPVLIDDHTYGDIPDEVPHNDIYGETLQPTGAQPMQSTTTNQYPTQHGQQNSMSPLLSQAPPLPSRIQQPTDGVSAENSIQQQLQPQGLMAAETQVCQSCSLMQPHVFIDSVFLFHH